MNLIITGASGFIGTNFIEVSPEYNITPVDLLSIKPEEINFNGIDTVLHLAALVHQMQGAPADEYFKINCYLSYEVAKLAKSHGVKHFVFMSTAKVFGESTTGKNALDENSDCIPLDSYGKSKYKAEQLILGLRDESFKVAIVRSPLVYGSGVKANMYNLIKLIDKIALLPLGGINNRRSMVFVGNLIALIKLIIEKKASGVFIAGDPTTISTSDLIKLIAKSLNKKVHLLTIPKFGIKTIALINPSVIDRLFGSLELNNSSTNKKLGFTPPYSIEQGIDEMVKWYQQNKE